MRGVFTAVDRIVGTEPEIWPTRGPEMIVDVMIACICPH